MIVCNHCHKTGIIAPSSPFGVPIKCYRCAGTGHIDWSDLRPGDHVCYFYDDPVQQLKTISVFLAEGLRKNERCVYILHQNTLEQVAEAIAAQGIDIAKERERKSLVFLTKNESYLASGSFDPEKMVSLLRNITKDALNEGFSGVRGTAEMSWALDHAPHYNALVGYELTTDLFFLNEQPHMTAVCQYDLREFSSTMVDGMRLSHRLVFQN